MLDYCHEGTVILRSAQTFYFIVEMQPVLSKDNTFSKT